MAPPGDEKARHAATTRPVPIGRSRAPIVRELLRRSLGAWWQDERTRFVLGFTVLAGCMLAFYYFPRTDGDAVERWTDDYLRIYTRLVSWPIGIFDHDVSAHGNLVAGRFSMQIVKSCDAMEANILFISALLAFCAPWRRKALALAVGLPALLGLNFVRLFVLYWVGVFVPSAFEFLHLDVWPLLMVAFAATDFVLCARWASGSGVALVAGDGLDGHAA
jgi:exosortase/archaeosortase family protein